MERQETMTPEDSVQCYDKWLTAANNYAYDVYNCNIEGLYQQALSYADSALFCLNAHYKQYSHQTAPLLRLEGEGTAAELECPWWNRQRIFPGGRIAVGESDGSHGSGETLCVGYQLRHRE